MWSVFELLLLLIACGLTRLAQDVSSLRMACGFARFVHLCAVQGLQLHILALHCQSGLGYVPAAERGL